MKAKRLPAQDDYAAFMSRAYTLELEATERYAQFAEQLETHNNREVAELFRKLSAIEALHAKRILTDMRWPCVPALPPAYARDTAEGPETAPFDSLHYLMHPWHALEIALRCETEAKKYYDSVAASRAPREVREAAKEMAAEEDEHIRLVREWMKRVPRPAAGWDEDPDPPRMNEQMRILSPLGWRPPLGYANGVAASGTMVFVAGQVGWNPQQVFDSEELPGQFEQALKNILAVLAEAGAKATDICRITAYCCDKPAYLAARPELGRIWRRLMGRHYPAMTMIFVSDLLDSPGKIELEATAVIPER